MKFNYQVRTSGGEIFSGQMDAVSRDTALSYLQNKGYYVTSLESVEEVPFYKKSLDIGWISFKDKMAFTHQLSILFKSGVPLTESLRTIGTQTKNEAFRDNILAVSREIEAGAPFSQAIAQYPKVFSPFYMNMIKSAEASGKLAENLDKLAEHMEREHNLREKVAGAMYYPSFILVVFVAIFLLMAFFVVPSFEDVLANQGGDIPWITRMVFDASSFMRTNTLVVFIGMFFVLILLYQLSKSESGRKWLDNNLIKIPVIGDLIMKLNIAQLAESLSTLISAGLPISQSLSITADVLENNLYKGIVTEMRDEVRRGSPMSAVLLSYPEAIPPLLTQMVIVGERTGSLEQSLQKVVDFYQQEVWRATDNLIALIEPVMIVSLGVGVAIFAVSVIFPIFSTMNSI